MLPIFHLILFLSYIPWTVFSMAPLDNCSFYCFLVPSQTDKINQNKELEPYKNLDCTHMVYAFAHVDVKSWALAGPTFWDTPDIEWEGNYKSVASLNVSANMTVLLGIFHDGKLPFIESPWPREKFAKEVVKTARWHNFQGIFFYFKSGEHFEDPEFFHFLETLKNELDNDATSIRGQQDGRLKTVLTIGSNDVLKSSGKFSKIEPYFDGFYLVFEDFSTDEDFSSPIPVDSLFANHENQAISQRESIEFIAEKLVNNGIPKQKTVIGLTAYANSFVFNHSVGSDQILVNNGNNTAKKMAYFEVCKLMNESEIVYDNISETTSFVVGGQWISLNVPGHESFRKKLEWIVSNNFSGVGLASLAADDKDDVCGKGPFPVHRYVGENLICPRQKVDLEEEVTNPHGCTRICIISPDQASIGFPLSSMDPQWCSHLVFSSAKIVGLPGSIFFPQKTSTLIDDYKQWTVENKPKMIISIGASEIPDNWRAFLLTKYRREALVQNINKTLFEIGADGVDVTWTRGHLDGPKDTEVYNLFLEELRSKLARKYLILTEITPQSTFNERYDFFRMSRAVDFIIAQGHRFHSYNKAFTGHHSPLLMSDELVDIRLTIEGFATDLIKRGVPKDKLIVGLTAEGIVMRMLIDNETNPEIGCPSSIFEHIRKSSQPGVVSQSDICMALQKSSTLAKFNPKIGVPYLIDGTEFIAYDDSRSIQMKTIWATMNNYGGIALFGVEMDNIDGECPKSDPFSLLKTIVNSQICEVCETPKMAKSPPTSDSCSEPTFKVLCGYKLSAQNNAAQLDAYMIPYQKCTEVVVEEVNWDSDREFRYTDKAQDQLRDLAQFHSRHQSNVRLISAIRCNMSEDEFKNVTGDHEKAKLMAHIKLLGFTGVEFRCSHLLRTPDIRQEFSSMLDGLKKYLISTKKSDECTKTISIRIPIDELNLTTTYNISTLNELHTLVIDPSPLPTTNTSMLLNPLFDQGLPEQTITLASTITSWLAEGIEPKKIVVGIPTYGTMQNFKNSTDHGLGSPIDGTIEYLTQTQLCEKFNKMGLIDQKFVYEAVGAYATTLDNKFLVYENRKTVAYKLKYAIRNKLGGVSLDSLNYDDVNNVCKIGSFPLLQTVDLNKCAM